MTRLIRTLARLVYGRRADRWETTLSLYLRLAIGPVVICDLTLFETAEQPSENDPPPQLAGGQGQIVYPEPVETEAAFGFR